ncbi:MAG: 30S ribosomal protein S18, partial [Victivallales bacterium]|nr:30S ribosomal protein S18 [Victivallales bacterium]
MREKTCRLCEKKIFQIDFKDVDLLKRYTTEGGKILPRRITGNCFKH